jgi:hypothetical protein
MRERYTQTPNELIFDSKLSIGARLAYSAIRHLAWQRGRRKEQDAVQLPPIDAMAELIGCSRTAIRGYTKELRQAGWIATSGRTSAMLYVVYDEPSLGRNLTQTRAESDLVAAGIPLSPLEDVKTGLASLVLTEEEAANVVPKLVKVDGRNPVFDALADSCDAEGVGRASEVSKAAHDINAAAWMKLSYEHRVGFAVMDATAWPTALAEEVTRRAGMYRRAKPDWMLTPRALAKYWDNVQTWAQDAVKQGLTPEEVRMMGEIRKKREAMGDQAHTI